MSHTPGPWEIEVQSFGSAIAKDGRCIATAHGTLAIIRDDLPHEANARLISAAPDMLEVLNLYDAYDAMPSDRGGKSGSRGKAYTAFVEAKKAAIAKATNQKAR